MSRGIQLAAVFIALVLVVGAAAYAIVRGIQNDGDASAACEALIQRLNNVGWFGYVDPGPFHSCNMTCDEIKERLGPGLDLDCRVYEECALTSSD